MSSHFALTNPLIRLLDKPREDFTRDDFLEVMRTQGLERITLHYTALDGKLKELKIPVTDRAQAERILADGERVDGSSLFKGLVDAAVSDLYVVPVYRSAFLNPFDPGSLDFVCRYLDGDGNLAGFTPDGILHNALQRFRETTGLDLYGLGELEFFLLTPPETPLFLAPKQHGYHATAPFVKGGDVINEMVSAVAQVTGAVKYAHSEVGSIESVRSDLPELKGRHGEQMEIEFLPTPIDVAADNLVVARWLIRNIAYRHGCLATFAPKLEEGVAGNGLHVHLAIHRKGRNAMSDDAGALTEPARRLIGGLCHYADSLTAFGNTTSAAYLRLVPNQEAPTHICWSDRNRSALIRVPLAWAGGGNLARRLNPTATRLDIPAESRQTVELRSPDGSALVHLLLAGLTMAVEWGLTHDEALETAERLYVTGNIFKDPELLRGLPHLVGSCVQSAAVLLEKRDLYERDGLFPPSVIDYMVRLLRAEKDEEMNAHLADLPADDRLLETRRIMHRDLHRH